MFPRGNAQGVGQLSKVGIVQGQLFRGQLSCYRLFVFLVDDFGFFIFVELILLFYKEGEFRGSLFS